MREILFRGKRIDNGKWVLGCLVQGVFFKAKDNSDIPYVFNIDDVDYDEFEDFAEGRGYYEVYPETVGQYTGLTDKNGKNIFEGDIVRYNDFQGCDYLFVVSYGACGGVQNVDHPVGYIGFYLSPADEHTQYMMRLGLRNDIMYYIDQLVVIGNVHDNPELMEDDNDTA